MTYVIAEPCVDVKDKACVDECPVDCIYEGSRTLYINPNECVDCGACEPVCPTEAIFYEDDLPDDWAWYKAVADDYFAEVGDFGGAMGAGPIDHDHELVAQLPSDVNAEYLAQNS
ncbi:MULTISPECIES: ferredoxin [Alloscardovia]|uniref:Ferredoxin n=2 Tax=Alloscardovia omnicolens TaxID=419015 RepID=A0A2I1M7X1_9BIFI|nr:MULTISPECIES: ferredoxin [Alloscardovia]KWZ73995.1 putative ferredoxin [Alloscardovia omnicolens]MDK6251483.1 ferredoxin family protein [Alloscardovia omnicolens]MDK6327441.1 ferredoxin family protein [Alloscardovia omnicolens]MDK6445599.1 ferredoxin family protein [Alloscardovia omnicolens]MDK6522688.1 ferredoxin family protein [Alloscardovia omnicolens]